MGLQWSVLLLRDTGYYPTTRYQVPRTLNGSTGGVAQQCLAVLEFEETSSNSFLNLCWTLDGFPRHRESICWIWPFDLPQGNRLGTYRNRRWPCLFAQGHTIVQTRVIKPQPFVRSQERWCSQGHGETSTGLLQAIATSLPDRGKRLVLPLYSAANFPPVYL